MTASYPSILPSLIPSLLPSLSPSLLPPPSLIPSLQPSGALPGIPPIDNPTHHHHGNLSRYSIHVQYILNSSVCHVEMFALLCIELSLLSCLGSQGSNPTQGSRTAFGFNLGYFALSFSRSIMYKCILHVHVHVV